MTCPYHWDLCSRSRVWLSRFLTHLLVSILLLCVSVKIQQFVILLGIHVLTKLAVIINYFISSVSEILGTIISRNPALLMYLVDILLQIVVGKSSRIFQLLI